MLLKKFKKITLSILLSLFIIPLNALAYSDYIIAGGENVGISIESTGIIVVGMYKVDNKNIAKEAGIRIGDIITEINGEKVSSINEMISKIDNISNDKVNITYLRENKKYNTSLNLIKDDGILKTGLYVKDSITGIGTLSFIDPNTKLFGALGHEIAEKNTGLILEVKDGKIFESNVTNIERSSRGNPGAKNATLNTNNVNGTIKENTVNGIFGTYTSDFSNRKKYKVATLSDIKTGEAKIHTVLDGNIVNEYKINILRIDKKNKDNKNILFEITDQDLLKKTGGVVQGMSGSPITQGDKIIGAVTHVVVDNPNHGYGIFITSMLEEAEN